MHSLFFHNSVRFIGTFFHVCKNTGMLQNAEDDHLAARLNDAIIDKGGEGGGGKG